MKDTRLALRRRVFLGAVGLGISAPLALRMSRMAVAEPGARPRRLLIVYIPHGVPAEHYQPVWDGTTLTLTPSGQGSFMPVGVLAPLQPFASQVSVVENVSMNDGANNHAAVRAVLTGFQEGKGSDSIDNIIAKAMGTKSWVLGALGYDSLFGFNENCYLSKQSTWVVPQVDPNKAANDMFGAATTSPTPAVDESAFRNQVLALTEGELDTLSTSLAGLTREQNKLQVHLDAVRALKASATAMPPVMSCNGRPDMPGVAAVQGKNVQDVANFAGVLDAHLELVFNAFKCGAASVITLQSMYPTAQYKMDFTGGPAVGDLYHDPTSHSQDAAGRARFAKVQQWFYERLVAKLIMPLATTPDGADTSASGRMLLDNTIIMTCSEIADGFFHNSQVAKQEVPIDSNGGQKMYTLSLPYVFIGGGSGYLKQGGQIVGATRMHTDVLATLADAMGVPITTMGTQAVSPIADLKAAS
jgi:hypothetical protein